MGVSKVIYGNDTIVDITDSTVNTNNLLSGEVAYGANGNRVVGSVSVPDDLNDLTDVNISSPSNGQILQYDNANSQWVNSNLPQSGHVIKNDGGTSMTSRSNLQFQGTYVSDDSTNNKTVVPIIRTMPKSQFDQLSSTEKKGFIDVTDEQGHTVTSEDVAYKTTSVKAVLDDITNDCVGFARNGIYDGNNTLIDTWNSVSDVEAFLTAHEVSTGKFTGLKVGQRIKINDGTYNKTWVIVGVDLDYKLGNSSNLPPYQSNHHICLIPFEYLFYDSMNDTQTVTGGYKGSKMYTTTLPTVVSKLQTVLSTHLLQQYLKITNTASSSGGATLVSNENAYASLMTECQVVGCPLVGKYLDQGFNTMKLPLFNFRPAHLRTDDPCYFWLRSVSTVSSNSFACMENGAISSCEANNSQRNVVRPYIIVG